MGSFLWFGVGSRTGRFWSILLLETRSTPAEHNIKQSINLNTMPLYDV